MFGNTFLLPILINLGLLFPNPTFSFVDKWFEWNSGKWTMKKELSWASSPIQCGSRCVSEGINCEVFYYNESTSVCEIGIMDVNGETKSAFIRPGYEMFSFVGHDNSLSRNYSSAKDFCRDNYDAVLPMIKTREQMESLAEYSIPYGIQYVWIGFTLVHNSSDFSNCDNEECDMRGVHDDGEVYRFREWTRDGASVIVNEGDPEVLCVRTWPGPVGVWRMNDKHCDSLWQTVCVKYD